MTTFHVFIVEHSSLTPFYATAATRATGRSTGGDAGGSGAGGRGRGGGGGGGGIFAVQEAFYEAACVVRMHTVVPCGCGHEQRGVLVRAHGGSIDVVVRRVALQECPVLNSAAGAQWST